MKALILTLLLSITVQAKEFQFTFHYPYGTNGNEMKFKTNTDSWEKAFELAATYCFKHYNKEFGPFSKEEAIKTIDSCVNPR